MNKRLLIGGLGAIVIGAVAALVITWYQDAPYRSADRAISEGEMIAAYTKQHGQSSLSIASAPVRIDPSKLVRLAVGGLGLTNESANRNVADMVLANLSGARGIEMVERAELDKALREISLSLSGLVRAQDAIRFGKLLRSDWFLMGTAAKINGTNSIVVRMVDAHTGVLREAGVFATGKPAPQLAVDLAAFVRHCRQSAAEAKPAVYLAIGAFNNVSLNSLQSDFPAQLRGYLTQAYEGGKVTLLEREAADVLFREARIDLAGLTEGGGTSCRCSRPIGW